MCENTEKELELLGFRVWLGYGRTGDPVVDFIDPHEQPIGEMTPQ